VRLFKRLKAKWGVRMQRRLNSLEKGIPEFSFVLIVLQLPLAIVVLDACDASSLSSRLSMRNSACNGLVVTCRQRRRDCALLIRKQAAHVVSIDHRKPIGLEQRTSHLKPLT
jgi:hypothetical protein